jgi:type I restriction enzyme S subunit
MNRKHDHKSSWLDDRVGARHAVPSGNNARDESKGTACRASTRDLPEGCVCKTLGEVAEINPRIDRSKISDDILVSFVPMQAVGAGDGGMDVSQLRPAKELKKGYTPFQEGDVLFAKITPCMENGKMAVVPKLTNGYGFGSTEFHVLRSKQYLETRYLYYFVSNASFRRDAAHNMKGAVGQKRVPTAYLYDCSIPIAPLDQQKLIVSEIEKQFSRLDEAVAGLKRVKANLKRYKASVLKAAVEGKLTEEWHSAHPNVESGAELLKRILVERKKKWEENNRDKKYKEPVSPDTSNLPELPKGWVWATTDQLASPEPNSITDGPFGSNLKTAHYTSAGPRVIRLQNIGDGIFVDESAHISEDHFSFLKKHQVLPGDLVIAALGETPPRACVIPLNVGSAIVKADCIRFHPHPVISNQYLNFALNSKPTRERTKGLIHGVGRPRLNLGEIKMITVPLPPQAEQASIVAEVERLLSVAEEIEDAVEINLKRAERLRQSILVKAFSGTLREINGRKTLVEFLGRL